MPQYTLKYFDLRGLAEPTRLLLHYTGTPFRDERIPLADWPTLKSSEQSN
jgi:hypothetical protein